MISPFLEDFGPVAVISEEQADRDAVAEEQRLAVFEQGYAAGWDDAIAAQSQNASVATELLVKNLEDLSFTYREVAAHMSAALSPFLEALTRKIVPEILDASAASFVVERLRDTAQTYGEVEVQVTCSPFRLGLLAASLPKAVPMPVKVVADAALTQDDICLRFAGTEQAIDLADIAGRIKSEIDAFTFQAQKDLSNG